MAWRRMATEATVPPIAQWAFVGFFVFTLTNAAPLVQAPVQMGRNSHSTCGVRDHRAFGDPVRTRAKPGTFYFMIAWTFWILFTIGGFLGPDRLASFSDKGLYQLILKLWISLVGMPLLLLRTISREKLPMIVKVGVLSATTGTVFSMAQMAFRGRLGNFSSEAGRGAATGLILTVCAHALTFFLFLSFAYPFRSKSTNLLIRGFLCWGFSRRYLVPDWCCCPWASWSSPYLPSGCAFFFQAGAAFAVVLVAANILVTLLQPGTGAGSMLDSEKSNRRLTRFSNLLQGKVDDGKKAKFDRMELWGYGWDAVMRRPLLGAAIASWIQSCQSVRASARTIIIYSCGVTPDFWRLPPSSFFY